MHGGVDTTVDKDMEEVIRGILAIKSGVESTRESALNKETHHTWELMGELFELDQRYKVNSFLGSGAYGAVCAAYDNKLQKKVAIKKCKQIFQSKTLTKRTIREIKLLRILSHDNVVKLLEVMHPQDVQRFSDIYVVFEIMETDLAGIIRSTQTISDKHIQYFSYQLISGLKYIHGCNVVHRDLKPRNVLVNTNCKLKIADFGLARYCSGGRDRKMSGMTEYVTTRWYRAPEILVGWCEYTSAVDMWAVGCIMAELVARAPIFPGTDTRSQLDIICNVLGNFPKSFIERSKSDDLRRYIKKFPTSKAKSLTAVMPNANRNATALATLTLEFDPAVRISAAEALWHPYFLSFRGDSEGCEGRQHFSANIIDVLAEEFTFETPQADTSVYRRQVLAEILYYQAHRTQTTQQDDGLNHSSYTESSVAKNPVQCDLPHFVRDRYNKTGMQAQQDLGVRADSLLHGEIKGSQRKESIGGDACANLPEEKRNDAPFDPNIFSSCIANLSPATETSKQKKTKTTSTCIVA